MCGIVGFNWEDKRLADLMGEELSHRGPDGKGVWSTSNLTLAHRRLAIQDLSTAGIQPMELPPLTIVYNGEVYNFHQLRTELERVGYRFHSKTDTEVVLATIHRWGLWEGILRFRGMFAFALYNSKTEILHLVRDRVGIKPLYYYWDGKRFLFASQLKAFFRWKKMEIDPVSLAYFFQYGYIPAPFTIFKNCFKLPPSTIATFHLPSRKLKLEKYWELPPPIPKQISLEEVVTQLEERLTDALSLRMVSDVPVGIFLSGGVDSSLVTALLSRKFSKLQTFTIGFKESRVDERKYAQSVASYLGINHHLKILTIERAKELIPKFPKIYDEPFGDSSGLPTFLISQIARENGIKVVLSADGGDELFGGYARYRWAYQTGRILLPLGNFPLVQSILKPAVTTPFWKKLFSQWERKISYLQQVFTATGWEEVYFNLIYQYRQEVEKLGLPNPSPPNWEQFQKGSLLHPVQGMMEWDFTTYLPDDILVKVDRATMENGIEGREPFLDHRIVEFAQTIPFEYKWNLKNGKIVLKKLLEKFLPEELIYRPKMGFQIPLREWLKGELNPLIKKQLEGEDRLINLNYVRHLYSRFLKGEGINLNLIWLPTIYRLWKEYYNLQ